MKRILVVSSIALLALSVIAAALAMTPIGSAFLFRNMVTMEARFRVTNNVVPGLGNWLFFKPELEYAANTLPSENVPRIIEFNRMLQRHGIALYVVPIPNKIDIYPEKFTSIPAPHPVSSERTDIMKRLADSGVQVIDLAPAFEQAKSQRRIFDPYESHWTPAGIDLAAKVIAAAIDPALTARKISRSTRYSVLDTTVLALGDMLDKIHGIGPDGKSALYSLSLKQVHCADGKRYVDDRRSKIMILGDSFVDRARWWSAHLGAQLARRIGHPTRTYCSLLANTDGPCMYQRMPSLFPVKGIVIWAFCSRVLRYPMHGPDKGI